MTNEEFHGLVLSELKGIKSDISGIKTEITEMKSEMSAMKVQQQENTGIIKILLPKQEIANAKLEKLEINTASKEDLFDVNVKIDTLNTRLFYQESELNKLRAIK